MVIGGYAVAYYGYSRFTADIEIWIEASPENADLKRNKAASERSGGSGPSLGKTDLIRTAESTLLSVLISTS